DAFLVVRVEGGATLLLRASRFHTRRKRRKWEKTVCHGGKLAGRERHGQPVQSHVENGIKNGTQRVDRRPTTLGLRRQILLQTLPLRIRKIAGIACTHSSSLSREVISTINKTRSKTVFWNAQR